MLVDGERNCLELTFLGGDEICIVPAGLSTHDSLCGTFPGTERYGHTIVTIGNLYREVDRTDTIYI